MSHFLYIMLIRVINSTRDPLFQTMVCSFFRQLSGKITYNGHEMDEFIPLRTSAYIGQHDLHLGELTVRETLAFSARCQGVGTGHGNAP